MNFMEILLIEDNRTDAEIVSRLLRKINRTHHLHIVEDGVQGMAFLRKEENFKNHPRPDLILLDLNLPQKNGLEVLLEVKQDPELRFIPTVVLSGSETEQDIRAAYDLGANSYITKPSNLNDFERFLRVAQEYWSSIVKTPGLQFAV
jgi:chemotaxis family two-component system response regulator Rcp1